MWPLSDLIATIHSISYQNKVANIYRYYVYIIHIWIHVCSIVSGEAIKFSIFLCVWLRLWFYLCVWVCICFCMVCIWGLLSNKQQHENICWIKEIKTNKATTNVVKTFCVRLSTGSDRMCYRLSRHHQWNHNDMAYAYVINIYLSHQSYVWSRIWKSVPQANACLQKMTLTSSIQKIWLIFYLVGKVENCCSITYMIYVFGEYIKMDQKKVIGFFLVMSLWAHIRFKKSYLQPQIKCKNNCCFNVGMF